MKIESSNKISNRIRNRKAVNGDKTLEIKSNSMLQYN